MTSAETGRMSKDCIFCKIVAGAVPGTRVYEDEDILAFMDIGPVAKGHTLVIPKAHIDSISDAPAAALQKLILIVQRIARAQIAGLGADGVNVTQANGAAAGQVVPHLHFHVIPRSLADGHDWNWKAKTYEGHTEIQAFAKRIADALRD
jgi:histidine triad (HIT) family protein